MIEHAVAGRIRVRLGDGCGPRTAGRGGVAEHHPTPRPGHRPATNHPTCRQGTPGECRRPATRIAPVADPPLFRSGRRLRSNRPLVRVLPRGSAPADRDDRRRFAPGPGMRRITERDPGTISHHRRPHRGMLLPRRLSRTTLARLARILARCDLRAAVYSRGALESARGCSRLLTGEGAENDVAAGARALETHFHGFASEAVALRYEAGVLGRNRRRVDRQLALLAALLSDPDPPLPNELVYES